MRSEPKTTARIIHTRRSEIVKGQILVSAHTQESATEGVRGIFLLSAVNGFMRRFDPLLTRNCSSESFASLESFAPIATRTIARQKVTKLSVMSVHLATKLRVAFVINPRPWEGCLPPEATPITALGALQLIVNDSPALRSHLTIDWATSFFLGCNPFPPSLNPPPPTLPRLLNGSPARSHPS